MNMMHEAEEKQKYYGVDQHGDFFEEELTETEAVKYIGLHATAVLFLDEKERADWMENF